RFAGTRQRRKHAPRLHVVFFFRAPRETGRQAHLHLRINASRKFRIAPNFDLAAPDFEKVEKAFRKHLRALSRSKRAEITSAIRRNPSRHITSRVFIAEIDLQYGWRSQPQQIAITLRKSSASARVQS